jgi:hypothetical protein
VGAVLSLRIGTVFIVFSDLSWERRRTSVEADRKFKRPFGGNALPTALAAPPARRGRAVRQHGVARRDFGWGWTCVSGTGRVVPQGCPGGKTLGRRGSTLPAGVSSAQMHGCGSGCHSCGVAGPRRGAWRSAWLQGAPPGTAAPRVARTGTTQGRRVRRRMALRCSGGRAPELPGRNAEILSAQQNAF